MQSAVRTSMFMQNYLRSETKAKYCWRTYREKPLISDLNAGSCGCTASGVWIGTLHFAKNAEYKGKKCIY